MLRAHINGTYYKRENIRRIINKVERKCPVFKNRIKKEKRK
jgi:hypothetical protein